MAGPSEHGARVDRGAALADRVPDALSFARVLCGPAFVAALGAAGEPTLGGAGSGAPFSRLAPLAIASFASLTDFVDGRLARRLGGGSAWGAALDVAADAAFLLCALSALAAAGLISAALPAATALSLLALWSSRSRRAQPTPPRRRGFADRIGHGAGIVNFAVVVVASGAHAGIVDGAWLVPASIAVAALNLAPIALRWRARAG